VDIAQTAQQMALTEWLKGKLKVSPKVIRNLGCGKNKRPTLSIQGQASDHTQRQITTFCFIIYQTHKSKIKGVNIMAGGWARDGAVQDQIDASVEDAVQLARSQLPQGESLEYCEACDNEIPLARRQAVPGVRLCITCQSELDDKNASSAGFNRRGSKDSQLR